MLSPAELVWMIRSFDPCAPSIEKDAVHRTIPVRIVRAPRNTCVFVIVVIPLLNDKLSSRGLVGRRICSAANNQACPPLFHFFSKHECLQRQPVRISLRAELLGPAVMGIA